MMRDTIPLTLFTTPTTTPTTALPMDSLSLHLDTVDIALFSREEVLVTAAQVTGVRAEYNQEGSGGGSGVQVVVGGVQVDNCLRDQHYDYRY